MPETTAPISRTACVQWLKDHDLYAGHSRDGATRLREVVAGHIERLATLDVDHDPVPTADLPISLPTPEPIAEAEALLAAAVEPAEDRAERLDLARAEWAALKAWQMMGSPADQPRPATPNLDAINADHAAGGVRRTAKAKTGRPVQAKVDGLRFYRRGKAMPNTQNKLSSLAYQTTVGMAADGKGRLTVEAFRAILVEGGATDPEATEWEVTLANGVVVAAKMDPPV